MKVLLINGSQTFAHSGGKLNTTLHKAAVKTLQQLGHEIKETHVEQGYDNTQEVDKILWADLIIYQMAGWWMGTPWQMKKYMDDVYTQGYGSIYKDDGRTRSDPNKQYGSGGLLQGRKYMLSVTWNAPLEAFNEFGNFFDGRGVDGVYFAFHKSQQFIGLSALPSFMANDVIKDLHLEQILSDYQAHLTKVFGQA
ncbi:NAD(P)H-dependent oxidoreductase [Utexia brackfieldae]|uniref:NAD(P)H-dependent oxidoreductase n=1 Tax=Utexia brackfieldae TaxID=3074108 RepID=UPI00370D4256